MAPQKPRTGFLGSLDELISTEHQFRFLDAFGKVTKKRTSLF
jgi:hypothetical protein